MAQQTPAILSARRAALAVLPLLAALSVLLAACMLAIPLFFMQVLDRVLGSSSVVTLAWLGLALSIVLMIQGGLEYLRTRAMQLAGDRLAARLDPAAFAAAAKRAGEGRADATQLLHDVQALRRFAASPAAAAGVDLAWAPLLLAVLALLHPAYALVALLCVLVLLGLNLAAGPAVRRALADAEEAELRTVGAMAMALRGAEAVVAMGMLAALARRWQGARMAAEASAGYGLARARAVGVAIRAVRMLMTGAMVATGVLLVLAGKATPGTMIAASLLLARVLLPFEQLGATVRAWAEATGAWRRMADACAEVTAAEPAFAAPCQSGALRIERLVYLPPGAPRPVLRGLSFTVSPGQVLAILGPSGAGKSTLLRLLLGMAAPTAGHVQLDGYPPHLWERADFARYVGFVPQHLALTDATIAETIARLDHPDLSQVIAAARAAGVHGLVGSLPHGYATRLREAGYMLSDGQRQRLALARALYGAPRLLLLDEPDAHLDAEGEAALLCAVGGVRARGGAVVLVTHRRGLLEAADQLLVLRDGLIDRQGARGTVLAELAAAPVRKLQKVPA